MFPWLDVILALAIGLAGLFGGCVPSEPVPLVRPGQAVRDTDEVTLESRRIVSAVSSPSAIPVAAPAQFAPTATQMPSPIAVPSPTLAVPSPTPSPGRLSEPMPTEALPVVARTCTARLTIVYDNNAYDDRLETAWGFSCLVEWGDLHHRADVQGGCRAVAGAGHGARSGGHHRVRPSRHCAHR